MPQTTPSFTMPTTNCSRSTPAVRLRLVASYAYDPFGRRASKYVASTSATTNHFYNDQQVVEEFNGSGGTAAYYTYGDGIDERITMYRGSTDYYYHSNRLGSAYLLSNGTGGILERYSYTPYGVVTVSDSAYLSSGTVSTVGNPYLFTSREFDPESALYNYRARTYDPVQGRFKQLDPIGLVGGVNLYTYCQSRPTFWTDLLGLASRTANWFGDYWYTVGPIRVPGPPGKVCFFVTAHYVQYWFTVPAGMDNDRVVASKVICVPPARATKAALWLVDWTNTFGEQLDAMVQSEALEHAEADLGCGRSSAACKVGFRRL